MTEDRNHKSINRFFMAMAFSMVILSIKVEVKRVATQESVITLFSTFWYLFIISLWVGLVGMFTQMIRDAYTNKKK